jgi:hypothetical protein
MLNWPFWKKVISIAGGSGTLLQDLTADRSKMVTIGTALRVYKNIKSIYKPENRNTRCTSIVRLFCFLERSNRTIALILKVDPFPNPLIVFAQYI